MATRSRSRGVARATRSAAENAKKVRELQRQLNAASASAASGDSAKIKAERAAWEREKALLKRGITEDDDMAVVTALYDRTPAKDRPSLDDWLDAHKSDPDKAPKSLRPFLGEPAKETPPARRGSPPPRSSPRESAPSAGAGVTVEAIRAAGERARREGTPEAVNAYKALRAQLETERSGR